MITSKITESPIFGALLAEEVSDEAAGAVVTFSGEVRNHDGGRNVQKLTYEVHPTAERMIKEIAEKVANKFEVIHVSVAHRFGPIPIGEVAFAVAVSAAHRKTAFECCENLVERVKAELPIWKFQEFTDGTSEWVNSA